MYRFQETTVSDFIREHRRERRLMSDFRLVAEHYPELVQVSEPSSGLEALQGPLSIVSPKTKLVRRVPVRIVFPLTYPNREPRAFDYTDRFLPHTWLRHFHSDDGRCCLWLPWNSLWDWSRGDALLDYLAHVVIFFNHQLLFDVSHKWPVEARGHGPDGFQEFLIEELGITADQFFDFVPLLTDGPRVAYLPCPCGSGKHAKRCHLVLINRLISKIGRSDLRSCVEWIVRVERRRLTDPPENADVTTSRATERALTA